MFEASLGHFGFKFSNRTTQNLVRSLNRAPRKSARATLSEFRGTLAERSAATICFVCCFLCFGQPDGEPPEYPESQKHISSNSSFGTATGEAASTMCARFSFISRLNNMGCAKPLGGCKAQSVCSLRSESRRVCNCNTALGNCRCMSCQIF